MAYELTLDKRMKCLPTQRAGAGVETLDGKEHIQVVVQAVLESLRQGLGLPLEQES